MKISIAMATSNGENSLTEQMNSIIQQTQKPDKAIISIIMLFARAAY